MSTSSHTPVRKEVHLRVPPSEAFEAFTARMGRWWPLATHSVGGEDAVDVVVDPRSGGPIVEVTRDGARHTWGTVQIWEPPRRLVTTWHPGRPGEPPTVVEVRFDATAEGTRVTLEHSGWEAAAWRDVRASYESGWDVVLGRFVASAERSGALT